MQHKQCRCCKDAKPLEEFWACRKNPDGKDETCGTCRREQKRRAEETPQGMYEMRARILATLFKKRWFGDYDNRNNMQLLSIKDNRRKGNKCSISIGDLYRTYQPDPELEQWARLLERVHDADRLRQFARKVIDRCE